MTKFATGLLLGLTLATITPAIAQSVSGSGVMSGWEVRANGRVVCRDPYVRPSAREVSCE